MSRVSYRKTSKHVLASVLSDEVFPALEKTRSLLDLLSSRQWRQSRWGPDPRTPPTFSPARVRILVDPGSIFRKYKCMIKLALTFSDQL